MIKFIPRNSHFTRISIFRNVIALFDNEKRHQIFMSSSILESVEHLIVIFLFLGYLNLKLLLLNLACLKFIPDIGPINWGPRSDPIFFESKF